MMFSFHMFNLDDNSPHEHKVISTSQILSSIHYPDNEDKIKKIGDRTILEFEDRVRRLAAGESPKKLGGSLHSLHGYVNRGFKMDNIKKE